MSDTPSVASRPTECELDLELVELVHWQRFATHLPDLTRADIEEIEKNRYDVKDQKLELFGTWLRKSSDASWNDVISALEKAQEKRLSDILRKKFNVPTFSLTSDLQINPQIPSIKCPPTPFKLRSKCTIRRRCSDTIKATPPIIYLISNRYSQEN